MPFPRKPYAQWTQEDVQSLIADPPAIETSQVDFKADCKLLSASPDEKAKARRDILVDIAALANGAGGALLIGVRQTGKRGAPPAAERIDGIENAESLKKAIDELINTHLDVRPAQARYHCIPCTDGKCVLIVEVSANTYSLSGITYRECNALGQFWVRRGTDNRLMATDEIQYRFSEFAKLQNVVEYELEGLCSRLERMANAPFVWVVGIPMNRARDHIPVQVKRVREVLSDSSYFALYPDQRDKSTRTPLHATSGLTPSLRGLDNRPEYGSQTVLTLARNGAFAYGRRIHPPTVRGLSHPAAKMDLRRPFKGGVSTCPS